MPHADDNVFFDHLSPFSVAPYAMGIAANMVRPGGNFPYSMEGAPLVHEICRVPGVNSPITAAMPGEMDGLELAKKVNSDRPEMALIVTSGHVRVPDSRIPDHGTFLPKPYHTGRLVDLVREKLDGRGR